MNKQKLEQDVQKQQEKLVLRKKRRIIESTTQSPLPKLTENNPEKNNSLDNSEQPQYMHNNLEEVRLKKRKKLSNQSLHRHPPFSKKDHLFVYSHILEPKNSLFNLVHEDMTTVASLKQSAIPWSYKYKPPDSNIQ